MKLEDIKIGKKYRVVKNRNTYFGSCNDIIKIEGQEVEVYDVSGTSIYIKSKNMTHVCNLENLELIIEEKIKEENNKINGVYTYVAQPYRVNWKIIYKGEITHENSRFRRIFF